MHLVLSRTVDHTVCAFPALFGTIGQTGRAPAVLSDRSKMLYLVVHGRVGL